MMRKATYSWTTILFITTLLIISNSLAADPGRIDLQGQIATSDGTPLCAMVLASGKHVFSCDPIGSFTLSNLPTESDGTIKLQVFARGFLPFFSALSDFSDQIVTMTRCDDTPSGSIIGSWFFNPGSLSDSAVLTFIDDANYMFAVDGEPDDGGGRGMERGTYTWDPTTGAFTVTAITGTSGDWGISYLSTMTLSIEGSTLTLNDSLEGDMTFTKIE